MMVMILPNNEENPEIKRTIKINIIDNNSSAVTGASVSLDDDKDNVKTTGSAGGCSFRDVSDGSHTVIVQKEGYSVETEEIIVDSSSVNFNIILTKLTKATVKVVNFHNHDEPYPNCKVMINVTKDEDSKSYEGFTDEKGEVTFQYPEGYDVLYGMAYSSNYEEDREYAEFDYHNLVDGVYLIHSW